MIKKLLTNSLNETKAWVAGHYIKIYLPVMWFFLFFTVQSAATELTGNAETEPDTGFIRLHGKQLLLHGIQIISKNATCKDNNRQWSCGEYAWEALKNKLDYGPIYCTIIPNPLRIEENAVQAICLLKKENLSTWLVSQGWALKSKGKDEVLSGQENLARRNNAGIWRGGFIPPDFWRAKIKKELKHCNVCSNRRQSFMRKSLK